MCTFDDLYIYEYVLLKFILIKLLPRFFFITTCVFVLEKNMCIAKKINSFGLTQPETSDFYPKIVWNFLAISGVDTNPRKKMV